MLRNYSFNKKSLLLFVILVVEPAIAEDSNTVIINKNITQGYITVSADSLDRRKKNADKSAKLSVHNKKNLTHKKAIASAIKKQEIEVEVVHIQASADAPVHVNKTERFIFRDITQRKKKLLSDSEMSARTAKIDFLRKQVKSR